MSGTAVALCGLTSVSCQLSPACGNSEVEPLSLLSARLWLLLLPVLSPNERVVDVLTSLVCVPSVQKVCTLLNMHVPTISKGSFALLSLPARGLL